MSPGAAGFRALALGVCAHSLCLSPCVCEAKKLQSSPTLRPHGLQPARALCPWDPLGKNTGVGCHFPLQGIFPTQGWNSGSLASPALANGFFTTSVTWEAQISI